MPQGDLITDGTVKWKLIDTTDGVPVGDVVYRPFVKAGYLECNGQQVNRSDYPSLVKFATDNNLWTSNQTNEPWKFGNGDGSSTMTVPNYLGRVIQGGSTTAKLEAGLPNIIASISMLVYGTGGLSTNGSGAFSGSQKYDNGGYVSNANDPNNPTTNNGFANGALGFRASYSNPIYGNSSTVQPPAIQLIPQIKY